MAKKESNQELSSVEAYDNRVLYVLRTSKVREGGRDFSFSVGTVVGDGNGQVGFGSGKAKEVSAAVKKANDRARRNMIHVDLKGDTLQHPMESHYCATTLVMKPAASGTGIIAGGALRSIFEVLGVRNVVAKCIGSTNPVNVVKAAIKSLSTMQSPEKIAEKRGKTVNEILGKKDAETE
jgi:small subunit ribosomal protein S5